MRCIISDIDGTICDVTHRRHFVTGKKKDFEAFHQAMDADTPNIPVISAYHGLCSSLNMPGVLCTGRFERFRQRTMNWLTDNFVSYELLLMRKDGDEREDEIVKGEMLDELIRNNWKPYIVLDDRNKVVDMWRARGLTCLQVAPGDF